VKPALSVVPPIEELETLPVSTEPPVVDPNLPPDESAELEQEPAPEDTIRDLTSLAETLGAEPDAVLEAIMVPNALGLEVPLGEALATWRQNEETFEARRQELETTYQTRLQTAQTKAETEVSRLAGLAKVLIQELASDFQGVDMEALRHTDAGRYVQLSEAKMRRRQLVQEVFQTIEASGVNRGERATEAQRATQREEAVKLIRKKPEWVKKPEIMTTIVRENQELMRHLGFSETEINGVTDHRFIIGLHYAAQHLKTLQGVKGKTVTDVKKRHLLRPSVLRQGSRQPANAPSVEARQERMQKFSQARDVKSAAALIETMLPPQR
jgi:hypothetical protein